MFGDDARPSETKPRASPGQVCACGNRWGTFSPIEGEAFALQLATGVQRAFKRPLALLQAEVEW